MKHFNNFFRLRGKADMSTQSTQVFSAYQSSNTLENSNTNTDTAVMFHGLKRETSVKLVLDSIWKVASRLVNNSNKTLHWASF